MERNDALRALSSKRRYVVVGLILGLVVAAVLNWSAERQYSSTTKFFVDVAPSTSESRDPYGAQQFSQQRVISYVQVLTGRELAQGVVDELDLPLGADDLTEMITATPLPDTVVLEVTVTDTSPERAQAIATSVARQFVERVQELETPAGAATPTVTVTVLEPPSFEPAPVSPAVARTLALGAALGLLLGFGVALLRVRLDRSLRSEEDAAAASDTEVLGRIPVDRQVTRRHVAAVAESRSAVAEAFRTIRVNLQHLGAAGRPKVLVVAGTLPGDGGSTVAVNLAVSLARSGSRVLLIDGDLRRPRAAAQLGLAAETGLSDVLSGTAELAAVSRPWGDGRLTVVGAGPLTADPAGTLGSPQMQDLLRTARKQHDYVIIDAPPLLSVIDGVALSALADGCLLVARFGRTTRDQLADATAAVTRVGGGILGVVLNRVPRPSITGRRTAYSSDAGRRPPRRSTGSTSGADDHAPATTDEQPDEVAITGNRPPPARTTRQPLETELDARDAEASAPPPAAARDR